MPTTYAELEIGLHRSDADSYQVELRFKNPDSEAEVAPVRGRAAIDLVELPALEFDPKGYGETLSARLFADPEVARLYARVKTAVETREQKLRVRLLVGPSAPELHRLRWELLVDPESRAPLATSERILFSRFVASADWRTIRLRPKASLRALIAVRLWFLPTQPGRQHAERVLGRNLSSAEWRRFVSTKVPRRKYFPALP